MFIKLVKKSLIAVSLLSYAATAIAMEQPQQIAERKNQAVFRVIDATGQDAIVSPKHSAQLLRCFAVNKLFDGYTLNLAQGPEIAMHQNLRKLFDFMAGDSKLEQLSSPEILTLFKLANYLEARAALKTLAPAAYAIEKKKAEKEQDQELLLTIVSCLSSYDSIEKLVEIKKENAIKRLFEPATGTLRLNPDALHAKITSLNGIQKLTHYCDPSAVIILDASNQAITDFRIADLKKAFPRLKQLNLSGNQIDKITCAQLAEMPKGFRLCLDNNPITNIEIGCFNNFARFKECLLSLKNTKLTFEHEQEAFANNLILAKLDPHGASALRGRLFHASPFIVSGLIAVGTVVYMVSKAFKARNYREMEEINLKAYMDNGDFESALQLAKNMQNTLIDSYLPTMRPLIITYCSTMMAMVAASNIANIRAWFQVRNPYHLHVTTDRARYNFPTIHHV